MIRSGTVIALVLAFLAGALVALLAAQLLGREPRSDGSASPAEFASGEVAASTAPHVIESGSNTPETAEIEVRELRSALEIEQAMRERLTREVQRLEALLAAARSSESQEGDANTPLGGEEVRGEQAASEGPPLDPTADWFGTRSLLALGMDRSQVDRIRRRWEQREMDKLYLVDEYARAAARGERRKGQLAGLMAIEKSAFDDLGDEGYDAMLYASGEKNRLRLTGVIDESPADLAGLLPGDEILRYDGNRIYRLGLLKRLTTRGKPGESVDLSVLRGSEQLHFSVARGPLGVRTEVVNRPPVLPFPP